MADIDQRPDYLYMWELDLEAVLTRENGNDVHTPITALVMSTDAAAALTLWMVDAPRYLRTLPDWRDVVSVRAEHVNSTRIMYDNAISPYILD